ncbi:MAG: hypothetical protein JXR60_00840 [Bacteroidales bacterium]|nr:hypothetical protein [Bacteroidales bacterium]
MRQIFSLLAILTLSLSLSAQSLESVDWGPENEMPDGSSYQLAVGFDNDNYYYVKSDHPVGLNRLHVWLDGVSSLTNTLEQSNEILLPSISGVQSEFESLFYKEKKFVLFSSIRDKNRNQTVLYVSYLNVDGSLKNKPKEVASVPMSNALGDGFNIFLSDDEKNIVVESHKTFKKYNDDPLNLVVLDFNLSEVFKLDMKLGDKFNGREVILDQNEYSKGKMIFLAKAEEATTRRSSKGTEYEFVVFVYNTAKKSIYDFSVKMPKYKVTDAKFTLNKDGNIVVGGFVSGTSSKFENEKQGMFYKRYNPNTLQEVPDIDAKSYVLKFTREFLMDIENVEYGESKPIQYAYSVHSVQELANGGYIILAEQKWQDSRTVVEAGSKEETGIQYFHYNNIMAGGITKEGVFNWTKIFPKVQFTTNDNGYYSSFKVVKIMNKLKLFYNGNKANLQTGDLKKVKEFKNNVRTRPSGMAGVYTIYMDGSYERDPLFPGKDNEVVVIPQTLTKNSLEYGIGVTDGKKVKFGSFVVE